MKGIFIAGAFILFAAIVQAQNVGIGTTTPSEKLTISSGNISLLSSSKGILLNGFDGPMINRGFDLFTSGNYTGLGRWGLFMEPNNLTLGIPAIGFKAFAVSSYNNNSTINKQLFRVSLDAAATNALVEVNGAMKIQGINTVEFGAGLTKEINAGKIGYQTFTPGALDIVGAGTLPSNRKVNIFAEGGTTFNGPINVGGSTGTTGQVLTSNGSAAPSWTNAAYANSTRFAVDLSNNSTFQGNADIEAIRYNLNPVDISIGASGITINRSGLYHFNIGWFANASYTVAQTSPLYRIFLNLSDNPPLLAGFNLITSGHMTSNATSSTTWRANENVSLEVYIAAPRTISLSFLIGTGSAISTQFDAYIIGHLISE